MIVMICALIAGAVILQGLSCGPRGWLPAGSAAALRRSRAVLDLAIIVCILVLGCLQRNPGIFALVPVAILLWSPLETSGDEAAPQPAAILDGGRVSNPPICSTTPGRLR